MNALIARMQSMPKAFAAITTYADGVTKRHETATEAQANNFAIGERHKIGRDLVSRDTGATVRVVAVEVVRI